MAIDITKLLNSRKKEIDAVIEKYIPRSFDKNSIEFVCGKSRYAYDVATATAAVNEPIWDLLDRGGKRWRPALFLLVYEAFGGDPKKVMDFVLVPEVTHNGTLMSDDVEDDSSLRRGQPCTHKKYGVDVAVNTGSAMYFLPLLAFIKNRKLFPPETLLTAYEIYAQEMINISYGQGMDIWWHKGKKQNVTQAEYLQMCAYKTGTLARMSAKLGALFAGATPGQIESIGKFAEAIGVAFQIQDDILNLVGEEFSKGKGVGEDIHEGKLTLLVIHSLANSTPKQAARLREILSMHPTDQKIIDEAISIIKKSGSIEYGREFASGMVRDAWSEVDASLKQSQAKEALRAFADYLVERKI